MDHFSPLECHSVFLESDASPTSERYTQLWIQLINRMERANAENCALMNGR